MVSSAIQTFIRDAPMKNETRANRAIGAGLLGAIVITASTAAASRQNLDPIRGECALEEHRNQELVGGQ
jgi:hypothetical protein